MDQHVIVVHPESGLAALANSPFNGFGLSKMALNSSLVPSPSPPFGIPSLESQLTQLIESRPVSHGNPMKQLALWSPYHAGGHRIGTNSDVHTAKIWLDAKAPQQPGEKKMSQTRRAYS
jgi:hypothetical protein